jgi:hypothetical protein
MNESDYASFLASIERTLEKNGFPERRVALPLERMYEVAAEKGLNFNKALALLETKGIAHDKTPERVIFCRPEDRGAALNAADDPTTDSVGDPADSPAAPPRVNPADLMARAQAMLASMSPEEMERMRAMIDGLSDEEKADLLARARAMGIGV